MTAKTITLTGAEIRAGYSGGANAWLRNDGTDVIYAAAVPGITAGSDGVVSIPAGQSAPVYGAYGTVYLLGTGSVQLIGSDYSTNPFKTSAQSGGSGADSVARAAITAHAGNTEIHVTAAEKSGWDGLSNPNLLINYDFAINQRGTSGAVTAAGYFVDCWKLVSGTVEVTADGLNLDGTIEQVLEQAVNDDVTASASAGSASYDDTTHAFTLTASGELVTWAKLEIGANATPCLPPNPATELLKCQQYYQRIPAFLPVRASGVSADFIDFTFPISVPMRIAPSANLSDLSICNTNYVEQDGFTPSVHIVSDGCICIRAAKTAHGMQDAIARAKSVLELSAEL